MKALPKLQKASKQTKSLPSKRMDVVWHLIQSQANDNPAPTSFWASWLAFWSVIVGLVFAWILL